MWLGSMLANFTGSNVLMPSLTATATMTSLPCLYLMNSLGTQNVDVSPYGRISLDNHLL